MKRKPSKRARSPIPIQDKPIDSYHDHNDKQEIVSTALQHLSQNDNEYKISSLSSSIPHYYNNNSNNNNRISMAYSHISYPQTPINSNYLHIANNHNDNIDDSSSISYRLNTIHKKTNS